MQVHQLQLVCRHFEGQTWLCNGQKEGVICRAVVSEGFQSILRMSFLLLEGPAAVLKMQARGRLKCISWKKITSW